MKKYKIIKVFGINFIDEKYKTIKFLLNKGGLLVLPSGPGLSDINKKASYRKALKNADMVLFDSGYLCLLLRIKGIKVKKFSGFKFFKKLLDSLKSEHNAKIFLVDPDYKQSKINRRLFKNKNIPKIYQYVAPLYKKNRIQDLKLLNKIKKIKPKYIIINLGGNVQEVLGYYLKKNLNYKPSIICSGAAIAYFTKQQAPLTNFLDNIYLGWLVRVIFNPIVFFPRYLKAFKLFFLVWNDDVNYND
jgi:N-acetylglucosaminyldiphosphoundecaprenol N-acetyl-beta-D-mannosaminyltransferase